MKEEKKRKFHPIVERALELAHKGYDEVEFDDYAVEQLQDFLRECFGKQELVQAVSDLVMFACFLDTEKECHSASQKIIKVVEIATEELEALLNKTNKQKPDD
jgi:hypothetical protein